MKKDKLKNDVENDLELEEIDEQIKTNSLDILDDDTWNFMNEIEDLRYEY